MLVSMCINNFGIDKITPNFQSAITVKADCDCPMPEERNRVSSHPSPIWWKSSPIPIFERYDLRNHRGSHAPFPRIIFGTMGNVTCKISHTLYIILLGLYSLSKLHFISRNLSEFPKILAIAVDTLLCSCNDQESDVRLVAGEALDRLIKVWAFKTKLQYSKISHILNSATFVLELG